MSDELSLANQEKLVEGAPQGTVCEACGGQFSSRQTHTCPGEDSKYGSFEMPKAGDIIGQHYKLKRQIGHGGMSAVFQAEHLLMKRKVSVKILHAHLMNEESYMQRFQKEAQAVGGLAHPNIVQVFDFGIDEKDRPYLVMDFLEGKTLGELIKSHGALPVDQAAHIFEQACDALEYAHSKGIVHRDLKPGNIMVVKGHRDDHAVKILDFGIAKIATDATTGSQTLTNTGEIFGSPLYMSPEQCQTRNLDLRSDIYSMGCLMYETLAGVPPLQGATAYETIYKHINEMPKPLRVAKPELKDAARFDAVILKAMAKDPRDRYQSMAELKEDLVKAREGMTTNFFDRLKQEWDLFHIQRGAKKASTMPLALIGFAAAFVLSGSFLAFAVSNYFGSHGQLQVDKWDRYDREGQAYLDTGAYVDAEKAFKTALSQADTWQLMPVNSIAQRYRIATFKELSDLERMRGNIPSADNYLGRARALEGSPVDADRTVAQLKKLLATSGAGFSEAEITKICDDAVAAGAENSLSYGQYDRAAALLSNAEAVARRLLKPNNPTLASALHYEAYLRTLAGDNKGAENLYREATQIRSVQKPLKADLGQSLTQLAQAILEQGHDEKHLALAEGYLNQAKDVINQTIGLTTTRMGVVYLSQGRIAYHRAVLADAKDPAKKQMYITESMRQLTNAAGVYQQDAAYQADYALCKMWQGRILQLSANFAAAREQFEEAVRVLEGCDGSHMTSGEEFRYAKLAEALEDLAFVQRAINVSGKADKAPGPSATPEFLYRRAWAIRQRLQPAARARSKFLLDEINKLQQEY